ncbi:MAG: CRISPR-associated endonuclease Cas2 [Bacteroidales bacterium]|jgi:CRISPR-associated protein Cas2|nr:CRISPR-associated endonuclease Cas2 [Bacteroidales bacterium]
MRKKKSIPFAEHLLKLYRSGLSREVQQVSVQKEDDDMPSIEMRVQHVLDIVKRKHDKSRMLFFVMYDIENDKVRRQVVKYLLRKGCMRIQKSIFIADVEHKVFSEIKDSLMEVQECYENDDSILVVPISTDYLQAMKIIGKNIDIDIILKNKSTIFI